MSRPADLPSAVIRYTTASLGRESRCEVIVEGTPVALLGSTRVEFVNVHREGFPRIKLELLADTIDLQTPTPQRSA